MELVYCNVFVIFWKLPILLYEFDDDCSFHISHMLISSYYILCHIYEEVRLCWILMDDANESRTWFSPYYVMTVKTIQQNLIFVYLPYFTGGEHDQHWTHFWNYQWYMCFPWEWFDVTGFRQWPDTCLLYTCFWPCSKMVFLPRKLYGILIFSFSYSRHLYSCCHYSKNHYVMRCECRKRWRKLHKRPFMMISNF